MTAVVSPDVWGAMCIYAEARNQPFDGQVAVGITIRERMRLKHFSDGTVVGTVWKPAQYSWTLSTDAQRQRVLAVEADTDAWHTAVQAWEASEGSDLLPPGTVSYYNPAAVARKPAWAISDEFEFVRRIGAHLFYRLARVAGRGKLLEGGK